MTDEDERMDRARRIREMREGARPDEEQAGEQDDSDDSGSAAEDDTSSATADRTGDAMEADNTGEVTEEVVAAAATTDSDGVAAGASEKGPAGADDAAVDSGEDDDTAETSVDKTAADEDASRSDGDGGTMHIPGAEVGDVDVDVKELAEQAGLDSTAGGDSPAGNSDDTGPAGPTRVADKEAATAQTEEVNETRVLEFNLGEERYCLDIEYVEEIVKQETVTRVPNTPDYVEGVVDLRGQITTILDPKELLDIDSEGTKELIVVFDPEVFEDQGAIGWVVDDVNQVTPIAEDEVNDSPIDQQHVNGVVDRDGEFVIWTAPELAIEDAAS